jgi:hypothetical protein
MENMLGNTLGTKEKWKKKILPLPPTSIKK